MYDIFLAVHRDFHLLWVGGGGEGETRAVSKMLFFGLMYLYIWGERDEMSIFVGGREVGEKRVGRE